MPISERFGFAGPVGWLVNQPWWVTVVGCLLLTPGLPMILAPVLESRWLPLSWKRQFLSFFPGDVFLSLAVSWLLFSGRWLPSEQRAWYLAPWVHVVIFVAMLAFAVGQTVGELRSSEKSDHAWSRRALLSPTKLYHNFVLYWGYGYLAVTSLLANVFGGLWLNALIGVMIASPLLLFLLVETQVPEAVRVARLRYAHVSDWYPVWHRWHIRFWKEI